MPAMPPGTWSWSSVCPSLRVSSIPPHRPAARRRRNARAPGRVIPLRIPIRLDPTWPRRAMRRPRPALPCSIPRSPIDSASPTRISHSPALASSRATTTASTSTTSRAAAPQTARVGGVPGRAGRRFRLPQPAVHVGRADARPRRLRHAGVADDGERRALSRHPHLRHHATSRAASRSRPCRRAAARTPIRSSPIRTIGRTSTSTGRERASSARHEELAGCSGLPPEEDPNTALFRIDVIRVPLAAPQRRASSTAPRMFADHDDRRHRGALAGWRPRTGHADVRATNQCHDITVFPELGLAAGACSGQRHPAGHFRSGESGPARPSRRPRLRVLAFRDVQQRRQQVLFTDEWGGGTRAALPRDRPADLGRGRHLRHRRRQPRFGGYYKLPAAQSGRRTASLTTARSSRCPAATSWPRRGIREASLSSTSPTRSGPTRSPSSIAAQSMRRQLMAGGYWSAYWYNGNIFASEMARGLDVFRLTPSEHLSQNEIAAAALVHAEAFNPQHQSRITGRPLRSSLTPTSISWHAERRCRLRGLTKSATR